MALHCAILYVPPLALLFSVTALGAAEWRAILWLSFPVILVDEALKYVTRCAPARPGPRLLLQPVPRPGPMVLLPGPPRVRLWLLRGVCAVPAMLPEGASALRVWHFARVARMSASGGQEHDLHQTACVPGSDDAPAAVQEPCGALQRGPERPAGVVQPGRAPEQAAAAALAAHDAAGPPHALLRWAGRQPPGLLVSSGERRAAPAVLACLRIALSLPEY